MKNVLFNNINKLGMHNYEPITPEATLKGKMMVEPSELYIHSQSAGTLLAKPNLLLNP